MKAIIRIFSTVHAVMALLFAAAALPLMVIAARMGWHALGEGWNGAAAQTLIEAIGLLAAAVVSLQMAQTIVEEEVVRDAHVSAPTRVRRFVSRFLVVVIVALAVEGLVATFKAIHDDLQQLPYAAGLLLAQNPATLITKAEVEKATLALRLPGETDHRPGAPQPFRHAEPQTRAATRHHDDAVAHQIRRKGRPRARRNGGTGRLF